MTPNSEKIHCYITWNTVLLLLITLISALYSDENAKYWRFGPQSDLYVISLAIDTYSKYVALLAIIATIKISAVVESDTRSILSSNIYSSTTTSVTDFEKGELYFYGSSIYCINSIRTILIILINISQADIALWSTLMAWSCNTFVIHERLRKKVFRTDEYTEISQNDTTEEDYEEISNET
jgi:hypothetical protein